MWNDEDLPGSPSRSPKGLQFWNGHSGLDFREGRAFWVQQLLAGKRLFPIGANDAHGDLNQNIGVKTPLFSLYQARNHVFGRVRTVVRTAERSLAGIQEGLRAPVCCTDGPYADLTQEGDRARILAATTSDFGPLRRLSVFVGKKGAAKEEVLLDRVADSGGPLTIDETFDFPSGWSYLRAEARTASGYLAITSPLFS